MMRTRSGARRSPMRLAIALTAVGALLLPAAGAAAQAPTPDPREGLKADDETGPAAEAAWNMELIENLPKPRGFFDEGAPDRPANPAAAGFRNSDMTFSQGHAFVGQYAGALIYDVTDPTEPELRTAVSCPGGQGDISVHGDLMFIGVQELGTVDCEPLTGDNVEDRFIGVRVFDISDLDAPQQVAAVQTCRGAHTQTVVPDPNDPDNVYIYVSGTNGTPRDSSDVEGLDCVVGPVNPDTGRPSSDPEDFLDEDGNPVETDRYQIEVIQVPIDAPEDAAIVSEPRLFADEETGNPAGLRGQTDACHDITAFPELGLAAGACEGNGLLIDISDPVNPVRIDYVEDETHFAYWHSATFNNDGTKVIFTDEWGGGGAPTCSPVVHSDPETPNDPNDGANAIFDINRDGDELTLDFRSYWKIPLVQTLQENCVAHNGNIIPVPGRDLFVQAWYQGGISVMDFTDSDDPREIAFFDRGPSDPDRMLLGGYWSAYYYNGYVYGSEIIRGFDVLELTPSEHLSAEELATAAAVRLREHNPQTQTMITDADRSACAGVDAGTFPDVTGGVHQGTVSCVAGYGIALGFADGTYRPGQDIQRGQMASFIQRMLRTAGVDLPASPRNAFGDDDRTVHELAINQLAELGIIQGKTATSYAPTDPVTRSQMASLIVRAVEHVLGEDLPAPSSPFTDVPSGWAHAGAIDAAYAAGIVQGQTATTFAPHANVRRDQMGSFIGRSLELLHHELVELNAIG